MNASRHVFFRYFVLDLLNVEKTLKNELFYVYNIMITNLHESLLRV